MKQLRNSILKILVETGLSMLESVLLFQALLNEIIF